MKILALDTSVGVSVAVLENENILAEFTDTQHGIQGEQTASTILTLLTQSNLTVEDIAKIVVGVGPGPYTGLRVGIATAQVLAFSRQIPIFGICSLDAVAHDFGNPCVVVTDARRKELYWAKYENGRIGSPAVNKPEKLKTLIGDSKVVGPAANLYAEQINGEVLPLRAAALGQLVSSGNAQLVPISPMYLRKPDATEPNSPKSVINAN